MTKDDIIKLGDYRQHILKAKCMRIEDIKSLSFILKDMRTFVSNKENGAFGLALPQIGVLYNGYVCRFANETEIFINPRIIPRGYKILGSEACLSEPGVERQVLRNEAITVKYTNIDGEQKEIRLAGFYARLVQHEQDHLNGVLLSDY